MSLVIEDGTGVVTANAYATVAEVDAILSTNIHSGGRLDPDSSKRSSWSGRPVSSTSGSWFGQKCSRPRASRGRAAGVKDREGIPIDDNLVPRPVKVAVAVLAEHLIAGNPDTVDTAARTRR
jgi:hypothetical protein